MKEIQTLINKFIQSKNDRNQISEAESFKRCLNTFKEYIDNKYYINYINQLERKDIEDYIEYLEHVNYTHNNQYRPSFIYRRLRALNKFFEFLIINQNTIDEKYIPKSNLLRKDDFPSPNRRSSKHFPEWFDKLIIDEIRKIPDDLRNIKFKTMIMFFYYTGVRGLDLCTLENECMIKKINRNWVRIFSNKTKRYYEIPLNDELYDALIKYQDIYVEKLSNQKLIKHPTLMVNMKFIFTLSGNPKSHREELSRKVKAFNNKILKTAEIQGYPVHEVEGLELTSHKFRHNIGIKLTRMGADPLLIAEFLGHGDLSMAQAYIQENEKNINIILDEVKSDETLEIDDLDDKQDLLILEKKDIYEYNDVVSKVSTGWCTHFNGKTMCEENPYQCWMCQNLKPNFEDENYLIYLKEQLEIHIELKQRNQKLGFIDAMKIEEKIIDKIKTFIKVVGETNE